MQTGMRSRAARFCGLLCSFGLLIGGCSGNKAADIIPTRVAKARPVPIARNESPMFRLGGLTLNNTLDDAKLAFPMPAGAALTPLPGGTVAENEHWGWETKTQTFDAVEQVGKLAWFNVMRKTLTPSERAKAVQDELAQFGKPTKISNGKAADAYYWRKGDSVRLLVNLKSKTNPGLLQLVGVAKILEEQGLPLDKLDAFVAGFEEPGPPVKQKPATKKK